VPQDEAKYISALKILKDYDITFAKMPPSTLAYLRPYFKNIKLESLRYCLFGGEPLYVDIALEWLQCIPNARMQNVYGPTEVTINCTFYNCSPGQGPTKSYTGIVSIGRPFGDSRVLVLGEQGRIAPTGSRGELCVSGTQCTSGYLNNPEQTGKAYVSLDDGDGERIYYRTGDQVILDNEGDLLYVGRIDNQVQIQGFRVELGEIEYHAGNFPGAGKVIAISQPNEVGNMMVYLFLENFRGSVDELKDWLVRKLPAYMLPGKIIILDSFPVNTHEKIDRQALIALIP
jgi:acyl-coenzyme A synthetase/AMP-(fatty) acid ligase